VKIYFGAEKKKWSGKTPSSLLERLKAVVIVPYDIELCKTYGKPKASLQEARVVVSDNDLWIAACAVRHSIPLISNNRKHFERIPDLHLISESPQETAPLQKRKNYLTSRAKAAQATSPTKRSKTARLNRRDLLFDGWL
jgi:PIN domain